MMIRQQIFEELYLLEAIVTMVSSCVEPKVCAKRVILFYNSFFHKLVVINVSILYDEAWPIFPLDVCDTRHAQEARHGTIPRQGRRRKTKETDQ